MTSTEQVNTPHEDGSLTLCNAAVQRLLDYGVLHYTDEGYYVGKWPGTNTPSRNTPADSEDQPITEADLERWAPLPAGMEPKPVDGEVAELVEREVERLIALAGSRVTPAEAKRARDAVAALSRNTEPMVRSSAPRTAQDQGDA